VFDAATVAVGDSKYSFSAATTHASESKADCEQDSITLSTLLKDSKTQDGLTLAATFTKSDGKSQLAASADEHKFNVNESVSKGEAYSCGTTWEKKMDEGKGKDKESISISFSNFRWEAFDVNNATKIDDAKKGLTGSECAAAPSDDDDDSKSTTALIVGGAIAALALVGILLFAYSKCKTPKAQGYSEISDFGGNVQN
jgi:hypothetical protein